MPQFQIKANAYKLKSVSLAIIAAFLFVATFSAASHAAVSFAALGQNLGSSDSRDAAVGDFDGDGDMDIVECPFGTTERVWRNNGDVSFTNTSSFGGSAYGCKAADMNNNGTMDIIIGIYSPSTNLTIYWNDGTSLFSTGPSVSEGYKYGFTIGDIDGDGDVDFTTGASNSLAGRVYRNNGNSTFSQIAANISLAYDRQHVLADVDNDGDLDLIRGIYNAANQVWLNNGSGSFSNLGGQSFTSLSTFDIVAGDFDADGDMDFAESNGGTSQTWVNDGSGIFSGGSALSAGSGYGVDAGDVDSDGDLDILIGYLSGGSKVYLNNGAGAFSNSGATITSATTDDVLFFEFNGDGMIDVLSVNSGTNPMKVWQNTTAPYTNTTPTAPTLTAQGSRYINANPKAIKFIWTAGVDPETPASMLTYDFRVGTTSGGCEINCGSFSGNGTAFGPGNADASPYNFKIAPGTYYWSVRTVDLTYTRSSWSAEDNFTVTLDTVAPSTPTVNDGTGSDVDFSVGNTTFDANWSASTDATAGVAGYWYSIGTSSGASDTKSWTWAGNVTSVTATGLTLTGGVSYYFSVRAQDNAENLSAVATSDGAKPFFYDTGQSLDVKTSYGGDLADFDNDGDLDFISAQSFARNNLYLNDGSGTMTPNQQISEANSDTRVLKAGDLDGDGDIDVVEGNSGPRLNKIYLNSGAFLNQNQSLEPGIDTHDMDLGDWDKDGDLDLIVGKYGQDDSLWENDGSGGFTDTGQVLTGASTTGVKFIDFDGDGDLDIVREIYGVGSKLWRNDAGTYTDQGYSTNTQQQDIKVADFDGDGDIDYAYAIINSVYRVVIMKNNGSGTFSFGSGATGPNMNAWGLEVGDIDGDGDYDVVDGGEFSGEVYANDGSGGLTYLLSLPKNGGSSGYQSADLGDLDGDGDLDVILESYYNTGDTVWINILNGSNSAPSTPSISAIADVGVPLGSTVKRTTFTWTPGSDAETTDADLLTYDVRAGTGSGLVNTVHGFFTGTPNYVGNGAGNASFSTSKSVDLPEGTYYWSARTVDSSYNRSSWDTEDSFVILPPFTNTGQALGGAGDSRMPCAGDFDGDGDLDVAETNYGGAGSNNYIYKNNGSGTMINVQTWSANPSQDCDVGDFDGDGDLDLAEANYSVVISNKIFLNNGSGTFSAGSDFGALVTSNNLFVADFDGDGDLDIYEGNNGSTNYIQLNDGTGTFTQGAAMGAAASANSDAADIDGDGDMDIAIAMNGSANYLWINNGDATFYDAGIYMNADSTRGVKFADVEGDGDQDLIFGNMGSQPNRVWMNNGAGVYTDSGQTLGAEETSGIDIGDLDGDGDIDFITGNRNVTSANLIWLNDGIGNFSDSGFQMGAYTGTWTVLLLDLDNDGDLDVFESCQGQANRVWRSNQNFTNTAPTAPSITPQPDVNPIWANAQATTLVWSVGSDAETTDADLLTYDVRMGTSPGSCDVFCGFFPETSLMGVGPGIMKNATSLNLDLSVLNTTTYYWSVRTVDATNKGGSFSAEDSFTLTPAFEDSGQSLGAYSSNFIDVADIDGDGDPDFLVSNYGQADRAWLNDGAGVFSDSGQAMGTDYSCSIMSGDLDGDGDLDYVRGACSLGTGVKVWSNNGAGTFSAGSSYTTANAYSVIPADVDGDGDLDVMVGNGNGASLVLTNDGAGSFSDSGQAIGAETTRAAEAIDVDGDGDLDYIDGNTGTDKVYKNDGSGTFTFFSNASTYSTWNIKAADVDGDGDYDYLNSIFSGQDRVFINNGSGTFSDSGQLLGNTARGFIDVADFDNDGDMDAVFGRDDSSGSYVFLNNGTGTFTDSGARLGSDVNHPMAAADVDGDGDVDIIQGNALDTPNRIYINNLNPTNTAPVAPALTDEPSFMTWSNATDTVTLNWAAGTDAETGAALLTYDVRIGTSPDTCDIFCGFFPSSGTTPLLGTGFGNTGATTSLTIAVPSDVTTTYYWSARTVDATYKRSSFAANDTFTVTPTFENSGQVLGNINARRADIADVDGDGDIDAIISCSICANKVWLNNGSGVFSDSGQSNGGYSGQGAVAGDLEGDGDIDYIEGTWDGQTEKIWKNNGSGTFSYFGQTSGFYSGGIGPLGDVDGDGDLDYFENNLAGHPEKLWINDGNGTFADSGNNFGSDTYGCTKMLDADGDGDLDIAAQRSGATGKLWVNNGTGSFTDSGQSIGGASSAFLVAADVDGDRDVDLVLPSGAVSEVWLNNGSGVFTNSGQALPAIWQANENDFDGDGDLDLVTSASEGVGVLLNDGAGNFSDTGFLFPTDMMVSLSSADFDADGDPDVLLARQQRDNLILTNNLNPANSAPSAPALTAEPDATTWNNSILPVVLVWSAGSDAETTNANKLTYDICVGTTSGDCDVYGGFFPYNGAAPYKSSTYGNAGATNGFNLNLPSSVTTTYYWSARTVDATKERSSFAVEDSFMVRPAFEDSGQTLGTAFTFLIALGDLDGDDDLDIIDAHSGVTLNQIWMNDGTGTFSIGAPFSAAYDSRQPVIFDAEGDGDLDFFEVTTSANKLWLNDGTGTFTDSGQSIGTQNDTSGAAADFDGDGDIDVIDGCYYCTDRLWVNDGAGTFSDSGKTLGAGTSAYQGDVDNDGDVDYLMSHVGGGGNKVWINDGTGTFTNSGQTLGTDATYQIALADVDGDGDNDVITGNGGTAVPDKIWMNNGSGVFTDSGQTLGSYLTTSVFPADLDGDGDIDYAAACNTSSPNRIWLNNGSGVFTDSGISLGTDSSWFVVGGDLDADDDIDLAVANASINRIYINNLNHGNNAPTAPAASAEPNSNTSTVQLQWNTGGVTDVETPAALLTYDVRIGTTSGGCETFCGLFTPTGNSVSPNPGNVGTASSITKTLADGTYYWAVRTVDTGFVKSAWSAEDSFLIDTTPPSTIATVNDGSATDVDFASSATQLLANWTTSTDAESGVVAYWIGIGTSPGATNTLNWTSAGLTTSRTNTGLTLTDGVTYYVTVRAENGVALYGTAANSDGQLVDTSAPSSVTVSDSLSSDVDYATSSTTLSANWTASADAHSGITRYWYAIGTTAGGTNVRSWTDNGLSTSVTATGLTLTDGVTYYFSVRAENGAQLLATVTSSDGQLVDTTIPSVVLVSDGNSSDIDFASSSTQLSANWTASADAHSGITRYWYAIGTTAGGTNVRSWTDNGLSTSVTATGLTLTDGVTYYFTVRAENAAGLLATAANSDGQIVDTSAPSSVAVSDSLSTDVDFATSSTTLSANWTASADAHSGITRYWYAIGTTAGGTNVRSWTDNGLSTSVTATGLTLTDGVTYYFTVRSENGAALLATAANSDGQLVDTTIPSSVAVSDGISTDVAFASSSTNLSANWTASTDPDSSIVKYWYAIGTTAGGTNVRSWTDNGLSTSVTATGLTLTDGVTYYFSVRAENAAGLTATAANSNGQTVDTSAPSSVLVSDGPDSDAAYASSTTQLKANWTASADAHSGITRYWYAIGTTAGGTNVRSWTSNGLSTSVTATGLTLTEGATYYFTVRSENGAALLASVANSNGMLVDVTPPAIVSAITADTDSNGYLDTLTITFDSTLYGSAEIADWVVTDGDGTTVLTTGLTNGNVSVSGTVVTITFANNNGSTGAPTYSYSSAGANNLRDAAGNPVAPFASAVATDNAPPVVMAAASTKQLTNSNVPSSTVFTITFSENVIVNGAQVAAADWSVTNGGWHGGAAVTYADGAGYSITATLTSGTTSGDWTESPVPTLNRSSSPLTVSGSIEDASGNDAIANATVNPQISGIYDLTPPYDVSNVNDGTGADVAYWPYADRLSANWTASSDPETGIYRYWYAVGTASGTFDVQTWTTNNVNSTSDTLSGLSLTDGSTYYLSVKAQNGAYMYSNPRSANGVMVDASAPNSCSISSITPTTSSTCQYSTTLASIKTLYYNNNATCASGGGTFTVSASGSDPHSKVQKINFPATVSAAADSAAPANSATYSSSLLYTYDSADVFSGNASATIYNYSNLTTACGFSILRDVTAPVTADSWTDNWTTSGSVTVTLSPADGSGAGVASTAYCSDTANACAPSTAGTSITLSCPSGSDCSQYVRWFSVDNVSNSETVKSERIRQDLKKPITTDNWTDEWTAAATVTVTLSPTDGTGSGVASTTYCVDTANACSPTTSGTTVVTTCAPMQTCTQYVRYMSADNVGNAETVNSKRVRQDRNLPLAATIAPANIDSGTHVDATFDLSTTFTTTGAPVATCSYCKSTDGACDTEWTSATWDSSSQTCSVSNLTCVNGQSLTLNMRATNNVGGIGYGVAVSRICDSEAPVTTDNWSGILSNVSPVTVSLSPTDALSGVQSSYYCVDSANACVPSTSGTSATVSCAAGTVCAQYVRYYSVDKTGNAETVKSKQVNQDMKYPSAIITAPVENEEIDGGVSIIGTATDENFKEFALYYAPGESPTEWKGVIAATSTSPLTSSEFAYWDTSTKYGTYSIMLNVVDLAGNISTDIITVGLYTKVDLVTEIPADEWRMISVPGVPDDSDPKNCFSHNDFIILRWKEALPEDDHMMKYTQTFTITAGRAFWVKSYVVSATCDSPSKVTDTTTPFIMPVDVGWNQIGTPFNRSYSWSMVKFRKAGTAVDISMADAIDQKLVDSGINSYQNKTYVKQGIEANLSPAVGYFIKILAPGDLIFDPGAGMATGVARATPIDKYAWRLQLSVESNDLRDADNFAGESAYSSDAFDSDDAAEPPFIDPYSALYFEHGDWEIPGRYSSDIRSSKRSAAGEEKTWLFTARTSAPEQDAKISWPGATEIPENYSITITDLVSGTVIDPRTTAEYAFKTGSDSKRAFSLTAVLLSGADNIPTSETTTLQAGWNFVSFPMEPVSANAANLMSKYPFIDSVIQYSNGSYAYAGDEGIALSPGSACWAYSSEPAEISMAGWAIAPDATIEISLLPGFNMISSPFRDGLLFGDNISVEVDGGVLTLSGAVTENVLENRIFEYDSSTGLYTQKPVGSIMEPWKGYFIKANKPCSLLLEK